MGVFGYLMLAAFVLVWVVLLVKFFRMTSTRKQQDDEGDNET